MNHPKILFVVPSLARAGAEKQVVDLANGLAADQVRCHVASFESNRDQLDRLNLDQVTYHALNRRWKFDWGVASAIADIIDQHDIDILHCTLSIGIFWGVLAANKAKKNPIVVAGVHTTINRTRKDDLLDRWVYRPQLRSVANILFVCNNQRDYWIDRDPKLANHSSVIYNGVDHHAFDRLPFEEQGQELKAKLGIPDQATTMCCVAAFRPEKSQGNIVRALATIQQNQHPLHLLLAGDGLELTRVQQLASDLGVADHIHFLGKLPDVRPVLAASTFSIIASVAVETFSFAMLESMAMSTPVVSTRIGGAGEAVIPGSTGILVQPGNIQELSCAINKLAQDPRKARKLGANARRLVEEKFTYATMVSVTMQHLMQLYESRGR